MNTSPFLNRVLSAATVLAPALLLTATLVTLPDDNFSESLPEGVIQIFAMGLFFLAYLNVSQLVATKLPRLSTLLLVTGTLGAMAGTSFGMIFIARDKGLELHSGALEMAFNLPGILFPMTWLALGLCVLYSKVAPVWAGAGLALAGICFPVSRISMTVEIALVADVLFLVSLTGIAVAALGRAPSATPQPQPQPSLI